MKVLVTGSLGLVGSEAVRFYLEKGDTVMGVDNNMREFFFGSDGSVLGNTIEHPNYTFSNMDICDSAELFISFKPDLIIHCAAQPSHDWSAKDPITDFNINAFGTLNLLNCCKTFTPDAVFIYVSTNKVYGDHPNKFPLVEKKSRWEIDWPIYTKGFNEDLSVDQCIHSVFGVSKLAGDMMCQEYGKNFGLKTGIFRCGCITGSRHAGAELHGFLSYVVKCHKENRIYRIYGYQGKQVRDQIHAYDLVTAFDAFSKDPKPGEVYNMGGSRHSNISVLEAMSVFNIGYEYHEQPRMGDHIWYISDVSKFQKDFPKWKYSYTLENILNDLIK